MEVAAILGLDNPKAFGDAIDLYNPRQLILRRKHGDAHLPATTAHKISIQCSRAIRKTPHPQNVLVVKMALRNWGRSGLEKEMAPALGAYAGAVISSDAGGASGMRDMRSQILNSVCSVPDSKPEKIAV